MTTDATALSAPGSYSIQNVGAGNANYAITFLDTDRITITKADAPSPAAQNVALKFTDRAEQSRTLAGLVPADAGTVTYEPQRESVTGTAAEHLPMKPMRSRLPRRMRTAL